MSNVVLTKVAQLHIFLTMLSLHDFIPALSGDPMGGVDSQVSIASLLLSLFLPPNILV